MLHLKDDCYAYIFIQKTGSSMGALSQTCRVIEPVKVMEIKHAVIMVLIGSDPREPTSYMNIYMKLACFGAISRRARFIEHFLLHWYTVKSKDASIVRP